MWNFPLALSLCGLSGAVPGVVGRELFDIVSEQGFHGVTLDGALPGMRARELDRSARRDIAAALSRRSLAFTGLDIWIPVAHLRKGTHLDRAVTAISEAMDLAGELATLAGDAAARVVNITLPADADTGAVTALRQAGERLGVALADHAWPPRGAAATDVTQSGMVTVTSREGALRVGIDPAAMLSAGADVTTEVSRLGAPPASARLTDLSPLGRAVVGEGRLDALAYGAALSAVRFTGPVVVDLRGLPDIAKGLEAFIRRWNENAWSGGAGLRRR